MENTLENQVSMFQKLQGGLELHKTELAVIPIMTTYKADFDKKVTAILTVATKAGVDITGYTVDKQNKRDDVTRKIRKLSTAAVAYSAVNSDFKLIEKCDASEPMLHRMRDNDFYTYSKIVIDEVTPIMSQLTPFGVVAADLTAANTALTLYLTNIQNPRIQISERSRYIEELENLVADTYTFVTQKMDKVMDIFSVTNPGLHLVYQGLRGVDSTGSTKMPDYKGTVMSGNINLIAELKYLASRTFEVRNLGKTPIEFALSRNELKMEGNVLTVSPQTTVPIRSEKLNTDLMATKMYVRNLGGEAADYKVWVIE